MRKARPEADSLLLVDWVGSLENMPGRVFITDGNHLVRWANEAFLQWTSEISKGSGGYHAEIRYDVEALGCSTPVHIRITGLDGNFVEGFAELSEFGLILPDGKDPLTLYIANDLTRSSLRQRLTEANLALGEYALSHSMHEILKMTISKAEELTGSSIGFFHFIDGEEKTVLLQAWSNRTMSGSCNVDGDGEHYPIENAGIWVDCLRQRTPLIHNDYSSAPGRRGLPQGHAQLVRMLTVPVLRNDRVVAILGVGNKSAEYTVEDVQAVSGLTNFAYEFAETRRFEEALAKDFAERQKAEAGLKKKVEELEWLNRMMVDREIRMVELKREVNSLLSRLGEKERYSVQRQHKNEG